MSRLVFHWMGCIILAVCVCTHIGVVTYNEADVKPQSVDLPHPEYPAEAREAGMEGVVIIRALVDTDGKIGQVKIAKSSGYKLLDSSAVEASKRAIFTPAYKNGKSVQCWVTIPYKFTLTK